MNESTQCSICRRAPLIGEQVVVMAAAGRESPLCELCLQRPRAAALGEAVRRERIRSAAGAANVRCLEPRKTLPLPLPAAAPQSLRAVGAG